MERDSKDHRFVNLLRERLGYRCSVASLKAGDWIRASSFASICPREEVLRSQGDIDTVSVDLDITYKHGHAVHRVLQELVLQSAEVLYGRWRCACGAVYGGLTDDEDGRLAELIETKRFDSDFWLLQEQQLETACLCPNACERCGRMVALVDVRFATDEQGNRDVAHSPFRYEEMWFASETTRLIGHPDGFVRVPWRKTLGIVEVKSVSSPQFVKMLSGPSLDHLVQAHVYMYLTQTQWAVILYKDKTRNGLSALLAHEVSFETTLGEQILAEVRTLHAALEGGPLPARICKTPSCERADACDVSVRC